MDLDGLVGGLYRDLAGVELGHRRFERGLHVVVFHPRGAIRQQAGGVDFGGEVGEFPLDGLELADGFAELLALLGVPQRRFVRALGHAEPERGDRNSSAVEHAHGVDKSVAFLAEQVFHGDLAVLENHFRGIAGAQAEFVFLLPRTEALGSLLDHERRKSVRVRRFIRHGDDDHHVGVMSVGDERLAAVQHPLIALADGRAARASGVGAGTGFGESPAADPFAGREFGNVLPALLFVAGDEDVVRAERGMCSYDDADRSVDARELLDGDDVLDVAHARAAEFGGKNGAQQAETAEFLDGLHGKARGFVPLHDVRGDLFFGEFADAAAQVVLLVGKLEIQASPPYVGQLFAVVP